MLNPANVFRPVGVFDAVVKQFNVAIYTQYRQVTQKHQPV